MAKIQNVYIVTSGDYDESKIDAVFSTENKAKEYIQQNGTGYRIEEYIIDKEDTIAENRLWEVAINLSNNEITSCEPASDYEKYIDCIHLYQCVNEYILYFHLQADCMDNAISIAKERLDNILKNKDTFYKKVFEPHFVKGMIFSHKEYERVNYFSGELFDYL